MTRLKNCLLASLGVVILALTLALTGAGRAIAQRVDDGCIRLCDPESAIPVTARTPLPVTGGVAVNGDVTVATSAERPLWVVVPGVKAQDIVQHTFHVVVPVGKFMEDETMNVPGDKVYMITYAQGVLTTTGTAFINVFLRINNETLPLPKQFMQMNGSTTEWSIGGGSLSLPVPPGSLLGVVVFKAASGFSGPSSAVLDLGISMH